MSGTSVVPSRVVSSRYDTVPKFSRIGRLHDSISFPGNINDHLPDVSIAYYTLVISSQDEPAPKFSAINVQAELEGLEGPLRRDYTQVLPKLVNPLILDSVYPSWERNCVKIPAH